MKTFNTPLVNYTMHVLFLSVLPRPPARAPVVHLQPADVVQRVRVLQREGPARGRQGDRALRVPRPLRARRPGRGGQQGGRAQDRQGALQVQEGECQCSASALITLIVHIMLRQVSASTQSTNNSNGKVGGLSTLSVILDLMIY